MDIKPQKLSYAVQIPVSLPIKKEKVGFLWFVCLVCQKCHGNHENVLLEKFRIFFAKTQRNKCCNFLQENSSA